MKRTTAILALALGGLVLCGCEPTVTPEDITKGIQDTRENLTRALVVAEELRDIACDYAKSHAGHQAKCDEAQAYVDAILKGLE